MSEKGKSAVENWDEAGEKRETGGAGVFYLFEDSQPPVTASVTEMN